MPKKISKQKTAAAITVTKAHRVAAANVLQSDHSQAHPEAMLARVMALEEKVLGAKPAPASPAPEQSA